MQPPALRDRSLWLLIGLYGCMTLLKAPHLWLEPRFWAEDGVIYYLQGRSLPAWSALWAMPLDYLSLPANLAGVLAAQLPLLYAPYASLMISLAIQCLVLVIVLVNAYCQQQRHLQAILLLIPIALSAAGEAWLNPINSQIWLALVAALILAAPSANFQLKRFLFNALTLLFATLSGVTVAFLSPLFVLRALVERRLTYLAYAGLASISAWIIILNPHDTGRVLDFPLDIFAVRSFLQLLLNNLCFPCSLWLYSAPTWLHNDFFALGSLVSLILVYGILWTYSTATGRWLLLASVSLLILGFSGALGKDLWLNAHPLFSSRYYFAPASLVVMSLLFLAIPPHEHFKRILVISLLAVFFLNGLVVSTYSTVVGERDGAAWKASVNAFEQGEAQMIYFNQPFCGFAPRANRAKALPPKLIHSTPTTLHFATLSRPSTGQQVYLYRRATQAPSAFQVYDEQGWQDLPLFLYGTSTYGQCYGGVEVKPAKGASIDNSGLISLDRAMLGNPKDYEFLLGYGENFASLLAHGSFSFIQGDTLLTASALNPAH